MTVRLKPDTTYGSVAAGAWNAQTLQYLWLYVPFVRVVLLFALWVHWLPSGTLGGGGGRVDAQGGWLSTGLHAAQHRMEPSRLLFSAIMSLRHAAHSSRWADEQGRSRVRGIAVRVILCHPAQ